MPKSPLSEFADMGERDGTLESQMSCHATGETAGVGRRSGTLCYFSLPQLSRLPNAHGYSFSRYWHMRIGEMDGNWYGNFRFCDLGFLGSWVLYLIGGLWLEMDWQFLGNGLARGKVLYFVYPPWDSEMKMRSRGAIVE
jgi:hypothetical protein